MTGSRRRARLNKGKAPRTAGHRGSPLSQGAHVSIRPTVDNGERDPSPGTSAEAPKRLRARTRVTRDAVLRDVAMMERLARRLRRFMMGLTDGTVEVHLDPRPPPIDDPTRALARRLLARSGFVKVKP